MGLRNRIEEFIADLGITTREFEIKCGLSNGSVNKMNDNTRVSTLDRISTAFPQLNIVLDKISEYLYEKETITGKQFMEIFREVKGEPAPENAEANAENSEDAKADGTANPENVTAAPAEEKETAQAATEG